MKEFFDRKDALRNPLEDAEIVPEAPDSRAIIKYEPPKKPLPTSPSLV